MDLMSVILVCKLIVVPNVGSYFLSGALSQLMILKKYLMIIKSYSKLKENPSILVNLVMKAPVDKVI
ncbi:hypothetical protein D3C85_1744970 [compost metagenome]